MWSTDAVPAISRARRMAARRYVVVVEHGLHSVGDRRYVAVVHDVPHHLSIGVGLVRHHQPCSGARHVGAVLELVGEHRHHHDRDARRQRAEDGAGPAVAHHGGGRAQGALLIDPGFDVDPVPGLGSQGRHIDMVSHCDRTRASTSRRARSTVWITSEAMDIWPSTVPKVT